MKKYINFLQKIENGVMVTAFILMILSSFAQVVNRNIFKLPIGWFDEVAVYSMIYMVLIGTEIGLRDGTQISVNILVDKLDGKNKILLQMLSNIIIIVFSAMIFWSSIGMVQSQIMSGQTSPALKLPMYVPYAALPISFGIIVVVQIGILLSLISNLRDEVRNIGKGGFS